MKKKIEMFSGMHLPQLKEDVNKFLDYGPHEYVCHTHAIANGVHFIILAYIEGEPQQVELSWSELDPSQHYVCVHSGKSGPGHIRAGKELQIVFRDGEQVVVNEHDQRDNTWVQAEYTIDNLAKFVEVDVLKFEQG